MTPEYAADAVQRARESLMEVGMIRADTPNRVYAARLLGITKTDIAALTGLSRTTVDRIIAERAAVGPGSPSPAPGPSH